MILILNILDNNSAEWILVDDTEKKYLFTMEQGKENILAELDSFLNQEKFKLEDIGGLGLVIKQASLTQVKVQVTIINTLGWQLNIPTVAEFYYKDKLKVENLVVKIKKESQFEAIKPEYQRAAEVTVSKKTPKFTISK